MEATKTPLISKFRILGLHGYKDVELAFRGPARIVIAENGSGKTTILSALQAVLETQFERLARIQFESIEVTFAGGMFPVVLTRGMIQKSMDPEMSNRISSLARWTDVDSRTLRRLILESVADGPTISQDNTVFRDIYMRSPMAWEEVAERILEIRDNLTLAQSDELKGLASQIQSALGTVEVLYLPTYRRVELPLAKPNRGAENLTRRQPDFVRYRGGGGSFKWEEYGIQFGLADVEQRLASLFNDIQRQSNLGYRVISANIIDELLGGQFGRAQPQTSTLPNIDALQRFLSRIESVTAVHRRPRESAQDVRIKKLKDLYDSGEIDSAENQELRYFLAKLARVVDETREVEANIEQFVAKANVYLQQSSDEKRLHYDAVSMKVVVQNLFTGGTVKLDELSSGEKQVVSLLAHLYLYGGRRIVLIDEPELSLSIDWQKRLLPDVIGSPTCEQLLAITHSPFIFDNELDPFAGPLDVSRRRA